MIILRTTFQLAKGIILRYTSKPRRGLFVLLPPIDFSQRARSINCGKEKAFSEDHSTFAPKQIQAG